MQEKIELLKELQGIDQELIRTRRNRRALEKEEKTLSEEVSRVQGMVDSLAADLEGLNEENQEITRALSLEEDNIGKAEGRLPAIKTQKEYVAVLKEIDTAKKLNKELQDKILQKEVEIETLARDKKEKEEELAEVRARIESRMSEIHEKFREYDEILSGRGAKRDEHLSKLPTPQRKRYQLLVERREGVAVVEARNGTCLGCNMHLPPQLFNSLFTMKEIQSCPHCNRLLFVEMEKK